MKREAKFEHYTPKRWHPEFSLIVIESISGADNATLSKKFGYTPQHISNILSTQQAKEIRERVRDKIDKEFEVGVSRKLSAIGEKAIARMEDFINDDSKYNHSPFHFIDRAIRIAETVGASVGSNKGSNVNVNGNAIVISVDKGNDIARALELSKEIESVSISKSQDNLSIDSTSSISNKLSLLKNG